MKNFVSSIFLLVFFPFTALLSNAEILTLTDIEGREMKAEVIDFTGKFLKIRREDGREFNLPPETLSKESLEKVNQWISESELPIFSPADYERFPYEIIVRTTQEEMKPSASRISIERVRGTFPKFEEKGEYIVIGTLLSDNFAEESLIFGTEKGFDGVISGYARNFNSEKRWTHFKLAVKAKGGGRLLLNLVGRDDSMPRLKVYMDK